MTISSDNEKILAAAIPITGSQVVVGEPVSFRPGLLR